MSSLQARTGRHRQRYDVDNCRLVAGCIPYRLKKIVDELTGEIESRLEVLMISSPNRSDLVFPKGGWEDDETMIEAACREAVEEAGVKGVLDEKQLGVWVFRSKSRQDSCSTEGSCRGYMFALQVTEELEFWPEQANHGRIWLSVMDAFKLCRYDWMRRALEEFLRVIPENERQRMMEDVAEHPILPPRKTFDDGRCGRASNPLEGFLSFLPEDGRQRMMEDVAEHQILPPRKALDDGRCGRASNPTSQLLRESINAHSSTKTVNALY